MEQGWFWVFFFFLQVRWQNNWVKCFTEMLFYAYVGIQQVSKLVFGKYLSCLVSWWKYDNHQNNFPLKPRILLVFSSTVPLFHKIDFGWLIYWFILYMYLVWFFQYFEKTKGYTTNAIELRCRRILDYNQPWSHFIDQTKAIVIIIIIIIIIIRQRLASVAASFSGCKWGALLELLPSPGVRFLT